MSATRAIELIMLALLAWGVFHAVGAYRFNHNPLRSLVVLACMLAFLGFWRLMLWSQASRLSRSAAARPGVGSDDQPPTNPV